jgi:hypothetical protein
MDTDIASAPALPRQRGVVLPGVPLRERRIDRLRCIVPHHARVHLLPDRRVVLELGRLRQADPER